MEPSDVIHRISVKFASKGHQIDQKQLTERLNRLTNEFGIPLPEAERTLVSDYSRQFGIEEVFTTATSEKGSLAEVTPIAGLEPEMWVNLEGMVTVIFPPRSPSIAQSGVLADKTGSVRFTVWARSNAPPVEVGKWYRFESAVTDEYNGQINFKVHSGTTITPLTDDMIPAEPPVPIRDLTAGLHTVEAKVTTIFPPRSASIAQSGILADITGTVNFTIWANAGLQELKEGDTYLIRHALAELYNGRMGLKGQQGTIITPASDAFEGTNPVSVTLLGEATSGIVTVEGKVVSCSHPPTEALRETGVIADNSGAVRFTIRTVDGSDELLNDTWYRIEGAVIDQYRGALNLRVTKDTKVTVIPQERTLEPTFIPVEAIAPGVSCLRVKMVQEWETNHERMLQAGIVGDETGTIRFVTWQDPQAERLKQDTVYRIYWAGIDEYNGQLSLTLSGALLIEDSGDFEVKSDNQEITGALVHISPGSGLIRRCPVEGCGRVLSRQNFCQLHEFQPNFTYDLRIKGWIDNGRQTWDTIISREAVEHITGMSIGQAQEMAENNPLGPETVFYHLHEILLGRYLRCSGRVVENRLFSRSCEFLTFSQKRLFDLINRAAAGGSGTITEPASDTTRSSFGTENPVPGAGRRDAGIPVSDHPSDKASDPIIRQQNTNPENRAAMYRPGDAGSSVGDVMEEYDTEPYDTDNDDEFNDYYQEDE